MLSVSTAKANAGIGLEGDRYALGTGAYSAVKPAKVRHISIIALSGIETANDWLTAGDEPTFDGPETRRNIALAGITASELNALVGQRFQLGSIELLGTELCTPCERPAQLLGRPSFMEAFEGRSGIRAEILNSGVLAVGDKLFIGNEE
ncbi:MOSC domain-containing protein [Polynucleobacter sp. AP-Reno-20A-A9]|uniref:MOSC domain-containing protein n=1 Tax=Polynucleobacter sp. AP-Reno-20A-A9 TaxID=2576925 RepID=UPI001C0E4E81|nr:MOSC domain-containing protein [Polynucleobacter sp. AP-Reno-20A-A9]MBU3627912.1 MOSC domain-containing protein [Polynucleobacter sp. AP-Reno-20A-A9]